MKLRPKLICLLMIAAKQQELPFHYHSGKLNLQIAFILDADTDTPSLTI